MAEALPYVGAAIGSVVPGVGTYWGWAIGSALSMLATPTQKSQGPRLDDLRITGTAYGQPIPFIQGTHRTAGQVIWASKRREIATTTEQGKGGGAENTTYTYEADYLFLLSSNELDGLIRVWDNGKLIYSIDDSSSDASLIASSESASWRRITFYGGDAAQLPDPTYEAAVGAGYAPAYRNMCTIFIEGLQLGQSGQLPNLTFEVGTNITPAAMENYQDFSGNNVPVTLGSSIPDVNRFGGTTNSPAKFGSSGRFNGGNLISPGDGLRVFEDTGGAREFPASWSIRAWLYDEGLSGDGSFFLAFGNDDGNPDGLWIRREPAGDHMQAQHRGTEGRPGFSAITSASLIPKNQWFYFELSKVGDQIFMFMGGTLEAQTTVSGDANVPFQGFPSDWSLGARYGFSPCWLGYMDDFVFTNGADAHSVSYFPPTTPHIPDQNTLLYIPFYRVDTSQRGYETLRTVVERLCARAQMPAGTYDATALDSVTVPVRALAASQIGGTRPLLEMLGQIYHIQAFCTDKAYFVPRAQTLRATIPYDDLGAAPAFEGSGDPFALRQRNDIEVIAQEAVTYANAADDYQSDTQYSDRLLTAQANTAPNSVPLALLPSEAKAAVDARVIDGAIGAWGSNVALPLKYAYLTPGDSVLVRQADGSQYRLMLSRQTLSGRVMGFEARLEDPTVFTQPGVTGENYSPQTEVTAVPGTFLYMLDIPQLRDADNGVGLYAAARGLAPAWPGARVYESTDTLSWSARVDITDSATLGTTLTELADWSSGNVFDEVNTVDVNVGAGTLSSATRDAVLADRTTNSILVGDEVLQYCTATLQSAGVYRLSRLLRERLGTDRLTGARPVGSRFILLGNIGMRRVTQDNSALAALRYFKGVSLGRALSTAATQEVTNYGVSVTPLSVVNVRANRNTTDTVITWQRRTRMQTRFLGALSSSVPLGEATEAYVIEIYSSSAFTTLVRTLTSSTPSVTYTSAQQVADFGSNQTVLYVRIYQLSEIVGRGFVRQVTI